MDSVSGKEVFDRFGGPFLRWSMSNNFLIPVNFKPLEFKREDVDSLKIRVQLSYKCWENMKEKNDTSHTVTDRK